MLVEVHHIGELNNNIFDYHVAKGTSRYLLRSGQDAYTPNITMSGLRYRGVGCEKKEKKKNYR